MTGSTSSSKWEPGSSLCQKVWAIIGILLLVVVAALVVRALALLVVPLILALFPATLLAPIASGLRNLKFPSALAALVTLVAGLALLGVVIFGVVTLVGAQLPDIAESADDGLERLQKSVRSVVPGFTIPRGHEVPGMIQERIDKLSENENSEAPTFFSRLLTMAMSVAEVGIGFLLLVVILFFYLKDGRRLAENTAEFVAPDSCEMIMIHAEVAWKTLGAYFRGQLLVAAVDAVLIGIGLVVLGVPLALPLAVIIFFGGLFPILGATVTGILAVLVAFSDGGFGTGLATVGLVLFVQQLESNVLEPMILSHVVNLNPLVVILSITLGALVLGVLGAFLAVPVVAVAKKVLVRIREGSEREASGTINPEASGT